MNGQVVETGEPYEFTGYATAYVLQIRSVSEDGLVTQEPIEVMFNAQTDAYQE